MTELLAGTTGRLRGALEGVPETERSLLELRLEWPALGEREVLIASRLRTFLLTWDPFWWMHDRGWAWATASGDGDSCEVVLYAAIHDAVRQAQQQETTLIEVIGGLAGSVVAVGVRQLELLVSGAFPQLAFKGEAPSLLSERGSAQGFGVPAATLADLGWEPIGLGAIQDLAQERFGPVDLDRSQVRLEAVSEPEPNCLACDGGSFGFPAELDVQRAAMCPAHAEQAQRVIDERLARAPASNRQGWDSIVGGSSMLSEPTFGLPLWLLAELGRAADRAADRGGGRPRSETELRAEGEMVLGLAARLDGRHEVLDELIEAALVGEDWLMELPWGLAAAGLVDEAVRVGDALTGLDRNNAAMYASDVAVILAEAGRGEQARERVERNLSRFPSDVWTRIHVGDVQLALSDSVAAERAFRDALALARSLGDALGVADANERLVRTLGEQPGRALEAAAAKEEMERASRAAYSGARTAVKIGRNDPCPCGSGRKYKRCCGA